MVPPSSWRYEGAYDFIIFGILFNNEDGRTWFKEAYNFQLPSDHKRDLSVPIQLDGLLKKEGIAFGCCTAPRRLELVSDFLVITQIECGSFIHDAPETYNEVVQEDLRPVPGVKDEEVKAWIEKEVGIKTNGYKSYYTNRNYY